jgi:hypothetical protein
MRIRKVIIISLLLILIVTAGCGVQNSYTQQGNVPDINPNAEAANKDTADVTLYFSYQGENLLAGETRAIDVPVSDTIETAVVRALISGPMSDELTGLFWPGVKLIGVDANADHVFITLNEEFISTAPEQEVVLDGLELDEQKRLAIYSIVNTIIEMGQYSRVQIYVAKEGGFGERITLSEAGWSDDDSAHLEPLERDSSMILTAKNTLLEALSSFEKKDWRRLYTFTAMTNTDGSSKPDISDFSEALAAEGNVLESFSVVDQNVSSDGQTAVVMLNYSLKTREGKLVQQSNIPIVLVREKGIWKLTYSSLVSVLINV